MTTRTDAPLPRTAYTVREVAASMGRSYKFVLALIHNKQLRAIPAGQQYLIPVAALDEFLSSAT